MTSDKNTSDEFRGFSYLLVSCRKMGAMGTCIPYDKGLLNVMLIDCHSRDSGHIRKIFGFIFIRHFPRVYGDIHCDWQWYILMVNSCAHNYLLTSKHANRSSLNTLDELRCA